MTQKPPEQLWPCARHFKPDGLLSMSKFPDFRPMLPGQARELLTTLLFQKMEQSPLTWQANPTFNYATAWELLRGEEHDWVRRNILDECYKLAEKQYDDIHPKTWDNANQKAGRRGYSL